MPNAVLVELGAALLPSHSVANADKTTVDGYYRRAPQAEAGPCQLIAANLQVGAEQANHQPARDCGRLWGS